MNGNTSKKNVTQVVKECKEYFGINTKFLWIMEYTELWFKTSENSEIKV